MYNNLGRILGVTMRKKILIFNSNELTLVISAAQIKISYPMYRLFYWNAEGETCTFPLTCTLFEPVIFTYQHFFLQTGTVYWPVPSPEKTKIGGHLYPYGSKIWSLNSFWVLKAYFWPLRPQIASNFSFCEWFSISDKR